MVLLLIIGNNVDTSQFSALVGHLSDTRSLPYLQQSQYIQESLVSECPEPEKCFNCRKEGHSTAECPDPEVCRRCRKEGHKVADCPEPQICNRYS